MNASELADKIETPGMFLITREMSMLQNKCVRFAADMEKILICYPRIERCETGVSLSIYDDCRGHRIQFDAPDIYSAARKAVEALEGKED